MLVVLAVGIADIVDVADIDFVDMYLDKGLYFGLEWLGYCHINFEYKEYSELEPVADKIVGFE